MKVKQACMAITALAMAGCSQNEIRDLNPEVYSPVGFSIYTGAQTKGTATTTATIQGADHFGILAYSTGTDNWTGTTETPNFMYNQEVVYSAGESRWTYDPVKYWPNEAAQKVSFFAYAPYETSPSDGAGKGITLSGKTDAGKPTISFKLKTDANKMVDLVTGIQKDREKTTDAVPFTLGHVLTRATFAAKLNRDLTPNTTYVFVTGVKILGKNSNAASRFYSQAKYTFDSALSPWSDPVAELQDYSLSTVLALDNQGSAVSGYPTTAVALTGTAEKSLFKTGEYLYLIPLDGGITTATDVKVKIEYNIVTLDSQVAGGYTQTQNSVTVSLPTGTLQAGISYKYVFEISLVDVTVDVQVEATVTDWGVDSPTGNI